MYDYSYVIVFIQNACMELNKRLDGIKKSKPDASWEEWISEAYFSRISLSATGYYRLVCNSSQLLLSCLLIQTNTQLSYSHIQSDTYKIGYICILVFIR